MSECLCEKWSGISRSVGTLKDSIVFRGYRHERTIAWGKGGANPLEQICAPHPPELDLISTYNWYAGAWRLGKQGCRKAAPPVL